VPRSSLRASLRPERRTATIVVYNNCSEQDVFFSSLPPPPSSVEIVYSFKLREISLLVAFCGVLVTFNDPVA
jgi:hypothetical protein